MFVSLLNVLLWSEKHCLRDIIFTQSKFAATARRAKATGRRVSSRLVACHYRQVRNCVLSSILLSRECRFGRRAVLDAIAYQRTYQAARTRLLRHYGLCVACGKAEAQAGRTRCRRCAVYASERTKKWLRNRTAGDTASPPCQF
jgi:hypothetical protein